MNHKTRGFFEEPIFMIERNREGHYSIEETTMREFLLEYCEGDPARAWFIKEVTKSVPKWNYDPDRIHELNYNSTEFPEYDDLPDEFIEVITYEVRERNSYLMNGSRLVDTFETEEEAELYRLNGLYWNFCNKSFDHPYVGTYEACVAEIDEIRMFKHNEENQ